MQFTYIGHLHFVKVFGIVRELDLLAPLNAIEAVCQCHVAMLVMMAVRFSVGSDVYQLLSCVTPYKGVYKGLRKTASVIQQSIKGHGLRKSAVIKKYGNRLPRWKRTLVGPGSIK